jgi:hypothetical protein
MARVPRDYRRNHIASASYLANFADAGGELCAVAAHSGSVTRGRPRTMGFRNAFWGEDREVRAFAERQLSAFESDASQASKRLLESGVPRPNTEDRLALVMLMAIHVTRNPAGRENLLRIQQRVLAQNAAKYRQDLTSEQYDELLRHFTSEAFVTDVLLRNLSKIASFLGSMHWTLVEFDCGLLATSDQPVTIVPIMRPGVDVPIAPIPSGPLVDCLEVRFALTPRHALVMAWIDEPDDGPVMNGDDALAAQLNRAVIAQADEQWFHHPARRPVRLIPPDLHAASCEPVSHRLHAGYDAVAASSSQRRIQAGANLDELIELQTANMVKTVAIERTTA